MISPADMAGIHARSYVHDRPWQEAEFASLLSQPTVFAVGDHRAFALVRTVADEAELLTIATAPAAQRQGHARALMTLWHAQAADRGATRALLEVAEDNTAARHLYTACGYAECARRPGYYARPGGGSVDALVMDRALA